MLLKYNSECNGIILLNFLIVLCGIIICYHIHINMYDTYSYITNFPNEMCQIISSRYMNQNYFCLQNFSRRHKQQ